MAMTGGTSVLLKSEKVNYGNGATLSLYAYWKEVSQSVENNTTTIALGMYLTISSSSYAVGTWNDFAGNGSYIGTATSGENCKTFDGTLTYGTWSGNRWLVENKQITISHNSDGTKTATIYWKWNVNSPWGQYVYPSGSFNITLTTIPRKSSVSAASGNIGSALAITIDRKSSSFTHTLKYSFGSASGTIKEKTTATSVSWTPLMSLCSEIPSATSGTCTITCETYSGSTPIGTTTCDIKLSVPSSVKLSVTSGWASVSAYNTGTPAANTGGFVQGYSKAQVSFTSSKISTANSYGATIKSYKIVYGSTTVTSSPYRTPVLTNAGTMTVYCYVTDTRGRTVGSAINFTVLPYSNPTISGIELFRCNSAGTEESSGNYIYVKATPKYSDLGGRNSITFRARYGVNADSYGSYSTLASGVASILGSGAVLSTASYIVEISVVDTIGKSSVYTGYIPTDYVTFHLGKGGKRAAFFKYAEKDNTLEIGGDLEVTGDSIFSNPPDFLKRKIAIPSGADLNDYITPGNYYTPSSAITNTLVNCPVQDNGFSMTVREVQNSNCIQQHIFFARTNYYRYFNGSSWYEALKVLTTDDLSVGVCKDVIIEQGTSGIWYYEKWASGKAECWGQKKITSYAMTKSGTGYYYGTAITESYPFAFNTITFKNTDVSDSKTSLIGVQRGTGADASLTQIGNTYPLSPTSQTVDIILNHHVKGTWK